MHRNAAPTCDITGNRITWNGVAAACKAYQISSFSLNKNTMTFLFSLSPARRLKLREHLRNFWRGILLDGLTVEFNQLCHDPTQCNTTVSKGCKEIIFALYIELFSYFSKTSICKKLLWCIAKAFGFITNEILPTLNIRFTVLFLKPRTYLAACC